MCLRKYVIFYSATCYFLIYCGAEEKTKRHVVTPLRVDKEGRPLTPSVHPHQVKTHHRATRLHYNIDLEGKQYLLELQLNSKLISNSTLLESVYMNNLNGTIENVTVTKYPDRCHFYGIVKGHPQSKVALSNCHGLMGFIFLDDVLYLIEPIDNPRCEHSCDHGHPHHAYTHDPEPRRRQMNYRKTGGKKKTVHQPFTRPPNAPLNNRRPSKARFSNARPSKTRREQPDTVESLRLRQMYMEALVVIDKTLIDFHQSMDVENYVLMAMNLAHVSLRDSTFGSPMELMIVRMIRLEEEDDEMNIAVTNDTFKALNVFKAWAHRINPTYDTHPNHHDVAILITRMDVCEENFQECDEILGLTEFASICDPTGAVIVAEDNGLALGYTIVHEIGHAMGFYHDSEDESKCDPEPYGDGFAVIMAVYVSLMMRGWSNCSREYMYQFIDSGKAFCLYDEPTSTEGHSLNNVIAGAAYGAHYQCRNFLGVEATECVDTAVDCSNLKCHVPQYGCLELNFTLPDGTPCAPHHWCYEGKCINEGQKPNAVDGQWTAWHGWSDCSRTCGGGVSKRGRDCDNPRPTHGGAYCLGDRVQYRMCNEHPCSCSDYSFRDQQCAEFNNWVYPETNKTHVWVSVPTAAENPCELVCINEEGLSSVLKSQVVDGTDCFYGEDHICVSGSCMPVACDKILGSKAVEDACGKCHGDGTSCILTSGEKHFDKSPNFQLLTIVPVDTLFAIIEETTPTKSGLTVQVEKTKVVTGKKFGLTKVDNATVWLGFAHKNQEVLKIRGPTTKEMSILVTPRDEVTMKYSVAKAVQSRGVVITTVRSWQHLDWSDCSEPCGPGTQVNEAKCVDKESGLIEDQFCNSEERPPTLQRICEMQACAPRWQIGEWSGCDCETCPDDDEERAVDCVLRVGNDEEVIVNDDRCTPPKPEERRRCPCPNRDSNLPIHPTPHKREQRVKKIFGSFKGVHHYRHPHTTMCSAKEANVIQEHPHLKVDRMNVRNLDIGLEITDENRGRLIPDFPKPSLDQNVVHLHGKKAAQVIHKIQKHSHNHTQNHTHH